MSVLALFVVFACGEPTPRAEPAPEPAKPLAIPAATGVVEVSAEGTRFDPPFEVAQIPDGAWMCDMGTVHYARAEPGEGGCPVCGMDLTQKVARAAPVDDHGDHDGHDH